MFLYSTIKPITRAGLLLLLSRSSFLWYLCCILHHFTRFNIYKLWNKTPSIRYIHIQSVPGGKANILWGHSTGPSKQKFYMYMCPSPNGFRDRAISVYSTLYTVQTSNTPCPHKSCKVHWCWRKNFRKCIIQGELSTFSLRTINTGIGNSTLFLFLINNFGTVQWNNGGTL
jgi:hypothetical protein